MNLFDCISRSLAVRPVRLIEPGNRVHSSVAIILKRGAGGLEVLLIERATNENDLWSGHIGLPGGKVEPADSSPRQTAVRETMEELGLDLNSADFLGQLRDIVPGGLPIVVSCFVYVLPNLPKLHPSAEEVADAFWFPLVKAEDPNQFTNVEYTRCGRSRTFPAIRVHDDKEQPVWGITYRLLKNLKQLADNCT
jgi:8-oxo-dGTP pyrophosphatase MutT (NUDIX family)